MKATVEDLRKMRCCCDGPGWRWKLAQTLVGNNSRWLRRLADQRVLEAQKYLRQREEGPVEAEKAAKKYRHLAAADLLNQNLETCDILKILVLGNCPATEIAERLQVDVEVVNAWEELHFDIRSARTAVDWVHLWVILPECQCGNGRLAAKMKLAFAAGPVAARAVLDAETQAPLDQGKKLFDQKLKLCLKFEEAVQLPLNTDKDKFSIIRLHMELLDREQRLRLAERKLEQRCQEAVAKQRVAEARLELAREREERRSREAAQRAAERDRKREERKAQILRREADMLARQHWVEERKQLAKERSAKSLLAQLRWEYSAGSTAGNTDGFGNGHSRKKATVPCTISERSTGPFTYESAEAPWIDEVSPETEKQLCTV